MNTYSLSSMKNVAEMDESTADASFNVAQMQQMVSDGLPLIVFPNLQTPLAAMDSNGGIGLGDFVSSLKLKISIWHIL